MEILKAYRVWWFHILFWGGHFVIRIFVSRFHPTDLWHTFWIELAELPIKIGLTYYIVFFLVPKLLKLEKFAGLLFWALLGLVAVALLKRTHDFALVFPLYAEEGIGPLPVFWDLISMFRRLIYIFPTPGFALALYFVWNWFENYRKNQQLEKEKLQAELNYLKGQIHPHFLFNTLNNLYALTLKNSPHTSDVVLKLSEMLSYMLYEANEPTVPLNREIDQINNYIALEKLRYGHRLDHYFHIHGNPDGLQVAPLLLVTFVENAFKHGVSGMVTDTFVHINLTVEGSRLEFEVENSVAPEIQPSTRPTSGIGLSNVKRRLQLIYPEKHRLLLDKAKEGFRVKLELLGLEPNLQKTEPLQNATAL